MDKLDQEIEKHRAAVLELEGQANELHRKLESARRDLEVLETAARLRPAAAAVSNGKIRLASPTSGTSASQIGVMSPTWLASLAEMAKSPDKRFFHQDIYEIAVRHGFAGSKDSCRDRVRSYLASETLSGTAHKGFKVTERGRARISAAEAKEEPKAQAFDSSN